jgi:adenylate kinase
VRIVLVGPPGAGKGTQAKFIASEMSIPKISTGDIFRANVSRGTPLGVEAKAYMDHGDLVPDKITIAMVRDRLNESDAAHGFLLDGFPRNVPQAVELDAILAEAGHGGLDIVLELVVDDDEVIRRISGRRICRNDGGHVFHVEYDPSTKGDRCEICDGELYQRDDDAEETVRHRLEVYADQTAPLVDFYAAQGILVGVQATGPVEVVTQRAIAALHRVRD